MEPLDDIVYLKQFVKRHPDNKMGWYLLGRKYKELGKDGKANYCFLQAGEVYEAYEQESHPLADWEKHEAQIQLVKEWSKRHQKRRLVRRTLLLSLLLFFLAVIIPFSNESEDVSRQSAEQQQENAENDRYPAAVVFVKQKEANPVGDAWRQLVRAGMPKAELTIAAKLEEKSGWRSWLGQTRLFMTVRQSGVSNEMDVSLLDRYLCNCEPGDQTELYKQFKSWSKEQEHHWTLASAIVHYERINGSWPTKLDDLIKPYPNNVLSGDSPQMRKAFQTVLKKLYNAQAEAKREIQENDKSAPKPSANSLVGPNGLFEANWSTPLEIVVDKETYQLAVVHGDIMIRSYKVGLGADRTPEGTFYISEKVKNPNGRDDGEFGSRGMTLSSTLYAIHGTDSPDSIGKDESLGCIRMLQQDVEELYDMVPLGTVVKIKNGTLPPDSAGSAERFKLQPSQDETNPAKVYKWLS